MWQEVFEKYGSDKFTVVGIALDAEGIAPAKRYYDRFHVKFPALVDGDYATRFGVVPKTFFVNEHGVVMPLRNWEQQLASLGDIRPVTDAIRQQWSASGSRLESAAIARLAEQNASQPHDLQVATQLASRYLALGLTAEARSVLKMAIADTDAKTIARGGGEQAALLGQTYFQLARASKGNHDDQVRFATLSYYLQPSVGFGKQIARIIAPEKFDDRPGGDFDNQFREGTLKRLVREREAWLKD